MKYKIDLEGQSAIVTGAATGIGFGIASALAACGASVLLVDMHAEAVAAAAAKLRETGAQVAHCACNVTNENEVQNMVEKAISTFGKIDLLYNNAGTISMCTIENMPLDEWEKIFSVNCRGVFLCSRAVIPYMKKNGGGRIISTASQAGKTGLNLLTHYCATKAAVIGFTKGLALELANDNIRVNCFCPGSVMTDMTRREAQWAAERNGGKAADYIELWEKAIPLGRYATPDDIANVAVFLASEMAEYMTGQAVNITGGQEMH